MLNLVILGAGNVATHLARAFLNAENLKLLQVYNRHPEPLASFKEIAATTTDISALKKADIYIIAIKDDVIPDVADKIPWQDGIMAHTSGSISIDALKKFKNRGVFYPLQTFSKERKIDFMEIPLCIEGNSKRNFQLLSDLGRQISNKIYAIDSQQRKSLHLSAVFVNNFSNHLYTLAAGICEEQKLPFEILKPLIKETAAKIEELPPRQAQTGPALRHDQKTIAAHLKMLKLAEEKIYSLLTQSIQKIHGEKL